MHSQVTGEGAAGAEAGAGGLVSYTTFIRDTGASGMTCCFFFFCSNVKSGRPSRSNPAHWSSPRRPNKLLCLLANHQVSQIINSLVISQKLFNQPNQQENTIIHLIKLYDANYSVAMLFSLEYMVPHLVAMILTSVNYSKHFSFDTAYTIGKKILSILLRSDENIAV
jgi:hypothetical protein